MIVIVISISTSVTILFVVTFILYLVYSRRRRTDSLLLAALGTNPATHPNSVGNKIFNYYFDVN